MRCWEALFVMSFASDGLVLYPISTSTAGRRAVVSTMKPGLLHPAVTTRVYRAELRLDQLSQPGRLAQVLVGGQVLQDEVESLLLGRRLGLGLEAHRLVLHLRHPLRVLGLGLGQEERLVPSHLGVPAAPRQRVDVQADEEVALLGAEGATVAERDERISRAGHPHGDAAGPQFLPKQQAHLQRDVLLLQARREEDARIAGIHAPVPRVDRDDVLPPEGASRQRSAPDARLRRGSLDRCGLRPCPSPAASRHPSAGRPRHRSGIAPRRAAAAGRTRAAAGGRPYHVAPSRPRPAAGSFRRR